MEAIITNDWDHCDISPETITYNEVVYQVRNYDTRDIKKAFLWHDTIHVNDIEENKNKTSKIR